MVLIICNLLINIVFFYNELLKYIRKVYCKLNILNNVFLLIFRIELFNNFRVLVRGYYIKNVFYFNIFYGNR